MKHRDQAHHRRTSRIDYEKELNPEQHAAVTAPPGPALVIAGAGSGKTRALTYRVAYLVENDVPPERILLLTFTNKAAKEMLGRAESLIPVSISGLWGGTFHSVGNRLLRRYAREAGLQPDFTILDAGDTKELLGNCFQEAGIPPKSKDFPKPEVVQGLFSFSANTRQTIETLLAGQFSHLQQFSVNLHHLAAVFKARKKRANAVDYDDLLSLPLEIFNAHPEILKSCQERWLYVLVDEYQDTNALQAGLVDAFAGLHKNVMAVGDDAQSIYSWRGANFANIFSFPERYPGTQVFRLETNYRSTPEILSLANASITNNEKQFPKKLRSVKRSGSRPKLVCADDSSRQAQFITEQIRELQRDGVRPDQIAVLYRAHSHALELQMEMMRQEIPFQITSGVQFFEQAHIKDATAFLKIAINPFDEVAFKRMTQLMPGVGPKAAEQLWKQAEGRESWDAVAVKPKFASEWQSFADLVTSMRSRATPADDAVNETAPEDFSGDAAEMIGSIVDEFYANYLTLHYDNHEQRLEDLRQLQVFSKQFANTSDFLGQLALMTNMEAEQNRSAKQHQPRVRLSTVHQAKGLEWKAVFVMMLCEGTFPLGRCMGSAEQIEEERRLFYVAMTRAEENLYLLYPSFRAGRGSYGDPFQKKSRFIMELPPDLMDVTAQPNQWEDGESGEEPGKFFKGSRHWL